MQAVPQTMHARRDRAMRAPRASLEPLCMQAQKK